MQNTARVFDASIKAPFTLEQVEKLKEWQNNHRVHPFTCAKRSEPGHLGEGKLVPTVRGWICPFCPYTQDWAHPAMVEGADKPKPREKCFCCNTPTRGGEVIRMEQVRYPWCGLTECQDSIDLLSGHRSGRKPNSPQGIICAHCMAELPDEAVMPHIRTCASNPIVQRSKELEAELEKLKALNEVLTKKKYELESENSSLALEVENLKQEVSELELECGNLRDDIESNS